jgi:iron complex outermembrane receptor protein
MIIRLKFILSILSVFTVSALTAQIDSCNYSVSGKILDVETKEPIPFVSVFIRGTDKGTIASENGSFFIEGLCSKTNTLIISCYGYCDSICEHSHQHGKVPHIYLTQNVVNLEKVIIKAEVNKKEGTESISQITIKKAELKANPTQSLASAIADQPGVSLISVGSNIELPVIHGLYGNRVLVLNNGLKHGFQNWGQDHAPEIDVSAANRITIVKGAAGVRYGSEALGGAVIVDPNPLYLSEPFFAEIGSGYQTNGGGYNSAFEVGKGVKKWSYFFNGNYNRIGDRQAPNYNLTNTGKEEISGGFGTRYRVKKWDLKGYYSLVDQHLAILRGSFAHSGEAIVRAFNGEQPDSAYTLPFSYEIMEPSQKTQHHLAKGELKWFYSDHGNLTYRVGRQINHRKAFDVRRNSNLPIVDLTLSTVDHQIEWKHPDWFKLNGTLGLQYFYQDNDNIPGTQTTPFIPNYNTSRYSAFVVESKRIGKDVLEAGTRIDFESNNVRGREANQDIFRDEYSFTNLTSTVGYVKNFSKMNSFRTNLGTAWRTPNMAELFSFGQHSFRTSYGLLRYYYTDQQKLKTDKVSSISDTDVQPEKGFKFTNELKINKTYSAHTITIYSNYIQNFIYLKPYAVVGSFRGPQPVFIYDQADAFFAGGDYSWKVDLSKNTKGTLGLSYLWSRNISQNDALINQPPVSVNYKFVWKQNNFWKFKKSSFIVQPLYRLKQIQAPRTVTPEQLINGEEVISPDAAIFDFKSAPDGYFRMDISWQFEFKKLYGSIAIKNVFNTRYRDYLNEMRYFADAPGRNFIFNINYKFKSKTKTKTK